VEKEETTEESEYPISRSQALDIFRTGTGGEMNLHHLLSMSSESRSGKMEIGGLKTWSRVLVCITFMTMTSTGINADGWMKTYDWNGRGAIGWHMEQLPDDGYIIVGQIGGFLVEDRTWLLRTDSFGDTLWTRVYEDTVDICCYCVRRTDDKGYILAGIRNESHGWTRGLLIRTDSLGDTLWTRTYGPSPGSCRPRCIQKVDDGGYIMVGSSSEGPGGVWLARVDSVGDTLWTKIYGTVQYPSGANWIERTWDGGYIIAARRGPASNDDIWLMKTDSLGDTLWTRLYGGENTDFASCVRQTSDSGYVIVGRGEDSYSVERVWLIKVDSVGDTIWTRFFLPGNDSTCGASGDCVEETYDGAYVVMGNMLKIGQGSGNLFLSKTDVRGDVVAYQEHFGGGCWFLETTDSAYTVVGSDGKLLLWHTRDIMAAEEEHEPTRIRTFFLSVSENPVSYQTVIDCRAVGERDARIELRDATGRKIQEFSFSRRIEWRIPKNLPSGCYFLRLQAGQHKETRKLCVLKGV
jgi:hypothetical protein